MSEAVKSWENSLKFNGSPDQMRAVYHLVASSSNGSQEKHLCGMRTRMKNIGTSDGRIIWRQSDLEKLVDHVKIKSRCVLRTSKRTMLR